MGRRLAPDRRRDAIVDAALAVAVRKGLGATTVRDLAAEMGTSSGLVHHYFGSMDEVLAAAFAKAAERDLEASAAAMASAPDPIWALRAFFETYTPVDKDWAFQLWLDAWAEAARRPALQATSRRLNLAWVALLEATIRAGVDEGAFLAADPRGAAWRIVSLLDGLALQLVAHGGTLSRDEVNVWATRSAEGELGLSDGVLTGPPKQEPARVRGPAAGTRSPAVACRGRRPGR